MTGLMLALGLGMGTSAHAEVAPQPQYVIQVTVWKGDPLGSKAEGTVEVLARPQLVVCDRQTGFVQVGEQVAVTRPDGRPRFEFSGLTLKLTPAVQSDGTVVLRTESQVTTVSPTPVCLGNGMVVPAFNCQAVTLVSMVKDTQTIRLRLAVDSPTDQTWAEVTVHVVQSPK
jgi:hypothetical protein